MLTKRETRTAVTLRRLRFFLGSCKGMASVDDSSSAFGPMTHISCGEGSKNHLGMDR